MKPVLRLVGDIRDPWDDGGFQPSRRRHPSYQPQKSYVRLGLISAAVGVVILAGAVTLKRLLHL